MRKLQTHDLFVGMRMLKEAKVKEALATVNAKDGTQSEKGFELVAEILGNCGDEKAENAILEFLSLPMEIPVKELRTMDALEMFGKIEELSKVIEPDEWRNFFGFALKMMK